MYRTVAFAVFGFMSFVQLLAAIAQEKVEPLVDIARDARAGAAPSAADVEKAYSACLKGVDAEFAAVKSGLAYRREARKAEEEICNRARRDCISNPSGASCKGFVVDYAE
jgi:hypothetical protein